MLNQCLRRMPQALAHTLRIHVLDKEGLSVKLECRIIQEVRRETIPGHFIDGWSSCLSGRSSRTSRVLLLSLWVSKLYFHCGTKSRA